MTKTIADENRKVFSEKAKLAKLWTESEKSFGNRGTSEAGGMHHCLWGMDAPVRQCA